MLGEVKEIMERKDAAGKFEDGFEKNLWFKAKVDLRPIESYI